MDKFSTVFASYHPHKHSQVDLEKDNSQTKNVNPKQLVTIHSYGYCTTLLLYICNNKIILMQHGHSK